jgi:hypothetical protein
MILYVVPAASWGDKVADENHALTLVLAGDGGILSTVILSKASPM